MPRLDIGQSYRADSGPAAAAHRSGFWGLVTLRRQPGGTTTVELHAEFRLRTARVDLGAVELVPYEARPDRMGPLAPDGGQPPVAICMATYNPRRSHFEPQVNSIRAQTHRNWICLINDDASEPAVQEMMRTVLGSDSRFRLATNERRLGVYRNFEACLARVPVDATYVALSDQDDRWHEDKVATLVGALESGAQLAYSDMRVVDTSGRIIRSTFWRLGRRNNHTDLSRMLLVNSVTGAASMFRRGLLEVALPFPRLEGQYHDHWLACAALSVGGLAYVPRPLHDYVQHDANVLGHRGLPGPRNPGGLTPKRWYATNVIGAFVFARELLARAPGDVAPSKRAQLRRVSALEGSHGVRRALTQALSGGGSLLEYKVPLALLWKRLASLPLPANRLLGVDGSTFLGWDAGRSTD